MNAVKSLGLVLVLLGACGPASRNPGSGDDVQGGVDSGTGSGDDCSADAKLIYVVDSNNQLSQFDATTKTFHNLGALNCPASGAAQPFSMGIDRNANAYVLYVEADILTGEPLSSELFYVDTTTLACTPTNWTTQLSLKEFGMGFSTDVVGGSTDSLFIAGGPMSGATSVTLAKVDVATMSASSLGTVQGSPELTGTGAAELWGFFPDAVSPRVAQLGKTGGAPVKTFPASSLAGGPMAWAFAFYGGDFFIFLQRDTDASTIVYQMNGSTGAITGMTTASGRTIVGAGVSTCAPTVIL